MKILFTFFFSFFVILSFLYQGCDGIFPSQSKPNVPDDHTSNYGGFLHRGENEGGDRSDDCNECHGEDLRGKLYYYQNNWIITSSCYQCHGNVWEEGGGDKKK